MINTYCDKTISSFWNSPLTPIVDVNICAGHQQAHRWPHQVFIISMDGKSYEWTCHWPTSIVQTGPWCLIWYVNILFFQIIRTVIVLLWCWTPNCYHFSYSALFMPPYQFYDNDCGLLCITHGDLVAHLWVSYQIRKIAGCACAGNAGNAFPAIAG